ncbi:MAG TPA: dTMP kinase [Syntrophales bacterium]
MERFITFEGIEGCGKSTQIKLASGYLSERGIPFIITEEPGGTPIGRKIREMLLNKAPYDSANNKMCAETELLLFSAARAQHIREVIGPAVKAEKVVLCDRFSDATIAYQGFGRGLDIDFIGRINDFSSAGLKPHFTLLFDLPAETGLRRALERISNKKGIPAEDRFEREALEFHRRVREGYLSLAGNEPDRFRIVDASRDIESVHREVCVHLLQFISEKL